MRISLAQMEVIPGRPDLNTQTMLQMIEQARQDQAELIVFPELCIPGYLLGDTWEQRAFLRDCEHYGQQVIKASQNIIIIYGNVAIDWERHGDDGRVRKYNALFVAYNGQLFGADNFPYPYRIKTLQPNYREFEDTRHFYSLRKLAIEMNCPVKDLLQPVHIPLSQHRLSLGCMLCEDGWSDDYALKPMQEISHNGPVDYFINISSSPFTFGKNHKRHRLFCGQAKQSGTPLIYVNTVGLQNNGKTVYTFDGSSCIYDQHGKLFCECPPFQSIVHTADLAVQQNSASESSFDDRSSSGIYQALYYGCNHFLQSIGATKVVIGVSGGIDSAVAAALYNQVVGPKNLLLVNMPSRFNSATTKDLAYRLAQNLGCWYTIIPIETSLEHTIHQFETLPIQNLSTNKSTTLTISSFVQENIQARDRSARILSGLAAAIGGIFSCNANKSEMTIGYSTLYGDLAGALAVLADLWKHQVYDLARYLNQSVYQSEVIPSQTITIVPSAELSTEQSVDEGKGDPLHYPYHDYLFRAFMERWDRATPEDILTWYCEGNLEQQLGCAPGLVGSLFKSDQAFIDDLERWWKLYTGMAVAKRIQAPPVLAVSRRAYGFDHREAQNLIHYTAAYLELKRKLLNQSASSLS